tara:strand:- start:5067 stop:5354 length:288 start_codon:yes stop_codon:yes gene_type:complete
MLNTSLCLKRFTASNGIVVEYSSMVYAISILKDGVNTDLVTTLLHQHFDEGTFRNMFGKYDRETYKALKEFCKSIGIRTAIRGRKNGRKKKLKQN